MAISRSLMNRQLYANGGIMQVAPREKFGLGSKLKKFVRKIIPNEVADIAVKAAPFVAPFNPALAAGMAGIGSFDQTGSIGDSLKRGALTYGGGQAARYIGGAGFQGNPFASGGAFTPSGFTQGFSSPIGTDTGLGKFFSNRGTEGVQGVGDGLTGSDVGGNITMAESAGGTSASPNILAEQMSEVSLSPQTIAEKVTQETISGSPNQMTITDSIKQIVSPNSTMGDRGNAALDLLKRGAKSAFTKTVDGKTVPDKAAIMGAVVFAGSYAEAKALAADAGVEITPEEYDEATKADKKEEYAGYLTNFFGGKKDGGRIGYESGANEMIKTQLLEEIMPDTSTEDMIMIMTETGPKMIKRSDYEAMSGMFRDTTTSLYGDAAKGRPVPEFANGGRIGFKLGSKPEDAEVGIMAIDVEAGDDEDEEDMMMAGITFSRPEKSYLFKRLGGSGGADRSYTMPNLYRILNNPNKYPEDAAILKEIAIMGLGEGQKDGGRIGFAFGSPDRKTDIEEELSVDTIYRPTDKPPMLEEMPEGDKMVGMGNTMKLFETPYGFDRDRFEFMYNEYLDSDKDIPLYDFAIEFLDMVKKDTPKSSITMAAKGGRIGYKGGANRVSELLILRDEKIGKGEDVSDIEAEIFQLTGKTFRSVGGISDIPTGKMRKNNAGVVERDYRDEGGFVPVGIKERADDVPAMLSKNEFVMTADAVRGIGNGSVEEGSKKLYNTMKQAEKVGKA